MRTRGNVAGPTIGLEREGYVLCERSTQDRRAVRVRLSALGERELLQRPGPAAQQSLHGPLGRSRTHLATRTAGVLAARRKDAR